MTSRRSVRSLLVALLATFGLFLVGLGTFSVTSTYRTSARHAEEVASNLAEVTAVSTRLFVQETNEVLLRLSAATVSLPDPAACEQFVRTSATMSPRYARITVVDASGDLRCASNPEASGRNANGLDWFDATRSSEGFTIGPPVRGRLSGDWIVIVSAPVRDLDGGFAGAVGVSIELGRLQTLVSSASLPEGAVITLAEVEGTVVARSEGHDQSVGTLLPRSNIDQEELARGFGLNRAVGSDDVDRLWGFRQVEGTPWIVFAGVPTRQIYGAVRAAALRNAAFLTFILMVLGLFTAWVYRHVAGSLGGLVDWAQAASRRSWDGVMPAEGPREVAEVAKAFGQTLEDRTSAEMRALVAKERYRSIFENAAFGIYLSTADGRFLQVNSALVRMLGYDSADELMKVNLADLYQRPEERGQLISRYRNQDLIHGVEVHWCRRDGEPITVRLNGRTVLNEADGVHFEVIAEDVTDRKSLEEQMRQAQKMEAVGRLAGAVAHDFNNILTVIVGQAQLMDEEGTPANAFAEEIIDSGQRAARLTRQLLAFSRKQDLERVPLQLDAVIQGLESMLRRLLDEDIELVTELAPDLRPTMADPGQIEQVLMNLVVNAQDALPDGGRVVIRAANRTLGDTYVRSHVGVQAGDYVQLSVSDDGVGMPRAIQSKVFEPFFTTKAAGEGSGLGLSTVYGIITQSGGHIELASRPGKGTTFHLYFPAAVAEPVQRAGPSQPPLRFHGTETVLVVEDEVSVRRVVCKSLERGGYHVLEAAGGEEGLEVARNHEGSIDLLLSDVAMPGIRGPELAEQLMRERPEVRVLFMSGYAEDPGALREVAGQPASFLAKPFTPLDILQSVWTTLQTQRQAS